MKEVKNFMTFFTPKVIWIDFKLKYLLYFDVSRCDSLKSDSFANNDNLTKYYNFARVRPALNLLLC